MIASLIFRIFLNVAIIRDMAVAFTTQKLLQTLVHCCQYIRKVLYEGYRGISGCAE